MRSLLGELHSDASSRPARAAAAKMVLVRARAAEAVTSPGFGVMGLEYKQRLTAARSTERPTALVSHCVRGPSHHSFPPGLINEPSSSALENLTASLYPADSRWDFVSGFSPMSLVHWAGSQPLLSSHSEPSSSAS
jgi:hypothetical protein